MSNFTVTLALLLGVTAAVADDDLKKRLDDEHARGADFWVYNDISRAREIAKEQNKPLFITFRCVPCKDCASFDAEVARGSDVIRKLAQENFISVRQVEMKDVDLSLFQFDYDLNWASMFINADGTVYARYGTQSAAGPDAYNSVAGLEKTMKRVLELHAKYPANRAELARKRGEPKPWKTALEMPGLPGEAQRFAGETTRRNCIHCHMLHDAENEFAVKSGTFSKELLWRFPLPDNVGLIIDAADGVTIREVREPAASSGLKVGDEITHINGQVMTSIADMQWVLHHLPNKPVTLEVRTRGGGMHTFATESGWKKSDISWRGSLWSVPPKLSVWAPRLPDNKRQARGVEPGQGAMEVKWINRKQPGGAAAFSGGLREGDVIIEADGKPIPDDPNQFQMYIKLNHKVGDTLSLTVLRNRRKQPISVKLVH